MKIGSLFAGIGGFDLAARWMGWETAWFSEIDPYASAVLKKHWPDVPNHGDITTIDFTTVEPVDMLCGGFPCQDISNAGKRAGIDGERSGLWSEYARAIGELRPRYVVVENVAALLGRGLDRVLGDLATLGYDAEWEVLSAADVGAPHLRERLWVVAYADRHARKGWPDKATHVEGRQRGPVESAVVRRGGELRADDLGSCCEVVADTSVARLSHGRRAPLANAGGTEPESHGRGGAQSGIQDDTRGPADSRWWAVEPDVGRVAHGLPRRVDRLRGLGNAIVPQCALVIFSAIQAREDALREVA